MILSHRELPAWCAPFEDTAKRYSICSGDAAEVREFVFTTSASGVVFEAEFLHAATGVHEVQKGVYPLPPDVLIAAAVESMRRSGVVAEPSPRARLWDACVAWRDKHGARSAEAAYQTDRFLVACPDLGIAVCDIVGYAKEAA